MWGDISQAAVGIAAILIAVGTFVMSSNDRRHRDDREELQELQERVERLTRERNEADRMAEDRKRERDDFERKYFAVLEENSTLRRGNL